MTPDKALDPTRPRKDTPGHSTVTQGTLNNLLASSAAALCSRLCTHPLDTLKTCIQVSNTPQPLLPTFARLLREGGLYRGLPIALALSAPGLSVYLTAYDHSKAVIASTFKTFGPDSVVNHMASGVIAEVCSGLFWTPMEILKSKQQVEYLSKSSAKGASGATILDPAPPTQTPTSTIDLAKKIYRQEGLVGFYRGYFITLGVFVPYSMLYFATYEELKAAAWRRRGPNVSPEEPLPFLTIVGCAALACSVAAGMSNMVDVVKTRCQTSILVTTDELSSTRRIATHMFKNGGLSSFTRGMGARIMWMVPSVTISMSLFEWFKLHGFV